MKTLFRGAGIALILGLTGCSAQGADEASAKLTKAPITQSTPQYALTIGHLVLCKLADNCEPLQHMASVSDGETIKKLQVLSTRLTKILEESYPELVFPGDMFSEGEKAFPGDMFDKKAFPGEMYDETQAEWAVSVDELIAALKSDKTKNPKYLAYAQGVRNSLKMLTDQRRKYGTDTTEDIVALLWEHNFKAGFLVVSESDLEKYALLRKRPGRLK